MGIEIVGNPPASVSMIGTPLSKLIDYYDVETSGVRIHLITKEKIKVVESGQTGNLARWCHCFRAPR